MVTSLHCPLCAGCLGYGTTTFTVDYGDGVVVVRHVPAQVCEQCGESWIEDTVSEKLQLIVKDAKSKRHQVEVIDLAA